MKYRRCALVILILASFLSPLLWGSESSHYDLQLGWGEVSQRDSQSEFQLGVRTSLLTGQFRGHFHQARRFESANSSLGLGYIWPTLTDGVSLSLLANAMIDADAISHQPQNSLSLQAEHAWPQLGSGLARLEARNYLGTQVQFLSYGLVIEKISQWLVVPQLFLTKTSFETGKSSFNGAASLRITYNSFPWKSGLAVSAGEEAYFHRAEIHITPIVSAALRFQYEGYSWGHPYIEFKWSQYSKLDRDVNEVLLGGDVLTWK